MVVPPISSVPSDDAGFSVAQRTSPPRLKRGSWFCRLWPLFIVIGLPGFGYGQILKPVSTIQFFISPDEKADLHWKMPIPGAPDVLPCQVSGYDGAVIAGLEAKQSKGDVELTVNLPRGFYTVSFVKQNQVFGLVVLPKHGGEKDPFFGLDAALSIFRSMQVRADLVQVLDRIGVSIARERLLWGDIQPAKDVWDWDTKRHYEQTRDLYFQSKIGVLELFHASPAWMQTDKKSVFPEDLPAARRAWEQIAWRWGKYWQGLEVWNEADIPAGQGGPQAEQYLPIVKTVRYALQEAGCPTLIGGGVFAYLTRPYMDLAAENGLLESSDFISFHYYSDPLGLDGYVTEYRRYLKKFGKESMPLWLTECGSPWLGNGLARPTPENDRNTATNFSLLAIEAKACGIERYFPFVLVAYTEHGNRNFGMLDRQETPVRSMSAYAQAICALSHTSYIGDIELDDKTIRARAFARKDGEVVVAVEGAASGKSSIVFPFPIAGLQGIDGRQLTPAASGSQAITDGMIYASAKTEDIKPHLKTQTRAMDLTVMSKAPQEARQRVSPVILAPSVDSPDLTPSVRGYEVPEGKAELPVKVRAINLSSKACTIKLSIQGNAQKESDQFTQTTTIPPESFTEVSASIKTSAIAFDKEGRGILRITGQTDDGAKILQAALYFSTPLGLEQCLANRAYRFALPISDFTRWEKNASGPMEFSKSPDGNWSFHVVYGAGDKWGFPRFTVPQEVDPDRITGVVVRGRCTNPATVRLMTWPKGENTFSTTGYSIFKPDGKWHVAYVPLGDFLKPKGNEKPGRQIGRISIGISDRESRENMVEISDLLLVGE